MIRCKRKGRETDNNLAKLFTDQDYARNSNLMPDLKALQANVDTTQALGFIKNKLNAQKYTDLSLIQEAARLK